jgi:hypothetical protein
MDALGQHVRAGNGILEECGRPKETYHAAPMFFVDVCMPKINEWYQLVRKDLAELIPEYAANFENVGNVTHNTDAKPAMIQQLERSLQRLDEIMDSLRTILQREG